MRSIKLICVGKLKEKFYLEACKEYTKRLIASRPTRRKLKGEVRP